MFNTKLLDYLLLTVITAVSGVIYTLTHHMSLKRDKGAKEYEQYCLSTTDYSGKNIYRLDREKSKNVQAEKQNR